MGLSASPRFAGRTGKLLGRETVLIIVDGAGKDANTGPIESGEKAARITAESARPAWGLCPPSSQTGFSPASAVTGPVESRCIRAGQRAEAAPLAMASGVMP